MLMRFPLSLAASVWFGCGSLFSQSVYRPLAPSSRAEPGLERAVDWKWNVAPPENKSWGMPPPDALAPKTPDSSTSDPASPALLRPETYEVKKGDAIIRIARRFQMSPAQLMQFNALKDDLILIGQTLRIPTPGELLAMPPPPPGPEADGGMHAGRFGGVPDLSGEPKTVEQLELEYVLLQVFLDREMFPAGPIDGDEGPMFRRISRIYQQTHPDAADHAMLKRKALAELKQPYANFILRAGDFKFINPSKGEPEAPPGKKSHRSGKIGSTKVKALAPPPSVTFDDLAANSFLAYTSAWEFVAERFHCDEAFLRRLNPHIKGTPIVGTAFQVPNVIPFEIEKSLEPPLQPAADPERPVTATVVDLSLLEISRDGKPIAVMPLATARPGLHGRGTWTILDATPQPRMATRREARVPPKATSASAGDASQNATPAIEAPPASEQHLASGPNNPVGIIWINLAKSNSTEPLIYGLHGTSIPREMHRRQGIGGFRLANWDIARVVRLLPAGTELRWKAH